MSPRTGYPWPIATTTLDNGLRVVVSEDHSAPVVAVNLWYDVGSRHEPVGQTGFAHLFEHLMFEGSVHVGKTEHFALMQGVGGSLNATTNPDRTNYFETIPVEHLELALWLEADRMAGLVPALTQDKLDNQREVVKNERRERYENTPYGDAWLRLLPLLYPDRHPYHHPTIGSMVDLDSAELATFQAFHRAYYAPNNAVLSIVGDIEPAAVYPLVRRYLGGIAPQPEIPAAPRLAIPAVRPEPAAELVPADVPATRIYQAHRTYPLGTPGYDAITVLSQILGEGRGSRMYRRLANGSRLAQPERLTAYTTDLAHGPAPLIAAATARPGVGAGELAAAVGELIDEFAAAPVEATELDRAKALLTTSWWSEMSTLNGRADALGRSAVLFGDPAVAGRQLPAWLAVTPERVQAAAAEVLRPASRVTLTYVNEEPA